MSGIRTARSKPEKEPQFPGSQTFIVREKLKFPGTLRGPWNVPYARNLSFTGRENLLEHLHNALLSHRAVALSGLGGIGKTQAAVEYAYRHQNDYTAILWVNASSSEGLVTEFGSLARTLNLLEKNSQDENEIIDAVKRWLEANADWLLIFDNADSLTRALEFIPQENKGKVLFTTRLHATGSSAHCVTLEKMEPDEGTLFLLRRAKIIPIGAHLDVASDVDRMKAAKLSTEMDGLPLALDQAGAFIEEIPSTLAEYLDLYQAEGARLRASRGDFAAEHPESVTITFSLAFAKVTSASLAATDLLRLCAFLAPDAIPEEMFSEGVRYLSEPLKSAVVRPLDWVTTIKGAGRFSLLRRNPASKMLTLHRLVQAVLKDGMDRAEQRLWSERAVRVVSATFPKPEFSNWGRCDRLLPQVQSSEKLIEQWHFEMQEVADLLNEAGRYLYERARLSEAVSFLQKALAIWEKTLGSEHSSVAAGLNNLAAIYDEQGRYTEAELLFQRALQIDQKVSGEEHPDVAIDLNNLAGLYESQGKYIEAESLYKRALAIREKSLGSEHHSAAMSLNDLAYLYEVQGRYQEALPLHKRSLDIKEKVLEPNHPSLATSLDNLAGLYKTLGRYTEAEPLLQQALKIREKSLGTDHPSWATGLNNLAGLYRAQGKYAEAEPLLQQALAVKEKVYGPEHPEVLAISNNLAVIYENQKKYTEAESLYQRALTTREKKLGTDHPDVATSLNNLATLYLTQRQYDKAESLFQRTLAILEKAFGANHVNVASGLNNLARLYIAEGQYADAEPLCKRSVDIVEKLFEPNHPSIATSLHGLARLYHAEKRYTDAEPIYQRVMGILEKAFDEQHPHFIRCLKNYAALLRQTNREPEAQEMEARAKAIVDKES